uniref:Alanine--glyoxylate aminotransferase 2, mitochondrial n=1 Tax=Romanomermis culicivorax TaxID=13658 RepID=A0A915I9Y7_ROMCU
MDKIWHSTNIYLHEPLHRYVEKLTKKMTGDLDNVYIVNSGSEANDLALMLARLYTKNFEIISLQNSYHGITSSILGIMNMGTWKHKPIPNFATHAVMNPDPYRGPWGGSKCRDCPVQAGRECNCTATKQCNACDLYIEQLENHLKHSVPRNGVAAIIVESIQGAGGTVQFPKGYVKRAFELVRQYGGICISDEVQTGFGRTGEHFWGYEMHGVQPDMVIMAKGIANGFPMAALVIDEEKLQENSHKVGTYFLQKLASLRDRTEIMGDVRGKGLMIGIELVDNKETRKPLDAARMAAIVEKTKDNGILVGKGGLYGTRGVANCAFFICAFANCADPN